VYQAKYKPFSDSSNSPWEIGQILRERNVVVVPASLPKAMYRICAGWVDSARATRVPIFEPDQTSGRDCAQVGEIAIHQTIAYGWLTAH
jgi:hypothetical protein